MVTDFALVRQIIREELESEKDKLERAYFGFDRSGMDALAKDLVQTWSRFQKPQAQDVNAVGKKHGLFVQFIGSGEFRATFSIGNDLVLKISLRSVDPMAWTNDQKFGSGNKMNEHDFWLGTDDEIEHVFPRAYMHAPDWSWIVLERVDPVSSKYQWLDYFRSDYLHHPGRLSDKMKADYNSLIYSCLYFTGPDPVPGDIQLDAWPGAVKSEYLDKTLDDLRADLLKNSQAYLGFYNLLQRYNVRIIEIHPNNLGIGSDGRLVLLDSSISPSES